jgi:hypothetical protein
MYKASAITLFLFRPLDLLPFPAGIPIEGHDDVIKPAPLLEIVGKKKPPAAAAMFREM